MKLSPIDIEKALEQSAAAPATITPPPGFSMAVWAEFQKQMEPMMLRRALEDVPIFVRPGMVETTLRRALERLGPHGEYWCKGYMRKELPRQVMRRFKPYRMPVYDTSDELRVEYDTFTLSGGMAFCTLGILGEVSNRMPGEYSETADRMAHVIMDANGLTDIPVWNDEPGRTFADVKQAFERAISYAKARNL